MNVCEETDPELSTRNNKSGVELSVEPLLIGHKGSSYQARAAAIGVQNHETRMADDEWRDHKKQEK